MDCDENRILDEEERMPNEKTVTDNNETAIKTMDNREIAEAHLTDTHVKQVSSEGSGSGRATASALKFSSFSVDNLIGTGTRSLNDKQCNESVAEITTHATIVPMILEPSCAAYTSSAHDDMMLCSSARTPEKNVSPRTVNASSPPLLSSSVLLSPTSSSLVANWSIQHLLGNPDPSSEHGSIPSEHLQRANIQDSILLHSPEKSIEQAVNAALCSLEKDMENTEEEEEDTDLAAEVGDKSPSSSLIVKDAVDDLETSFVDSEEGNEDRQSHTHGDQSSDCQRLKVEFDPDNIQYTPKPLARTKKPYKPSSEKRSIKSYWFREFPWLVYDEAKKLFFCSYCTAVKCDNIFTRGRPAVKPRKDYMVKHESTNPHKTAMSRLQIIPEVLKRDECPGNPKINKRLSTLKQMKPHLAEKIPDEIDASTAHFLKFIPSEQTGPENRAVHERWFLEFIWFVYNHTEGKFFCKLCRDAGVKGVYTQGKCALNPKKGDLLVHERTSQHIGVLKKLGLPVPPKKENPRRKRETARIRCGESSIDDNRVVKPGNITDNESKDNLERDLPVTAKEKTKTRRQIKSCWFNDFPWLNYSDEKDCFFCILCRKYDQPGVFSTGKRATIPKKDNFVKHEDTESHHIALLQEAGMNKEQAMEQVTSGFSNHSKKNSFIMGPDEDIDMIGFMNTHEQQEAYVPNTQLQEPQLSHVNTNQQDTESNNIKTDDQETVANQKSPDESALDILASMSVEGRVPQSVLTNVSSSRNGQFHNIQMEWFVEFCWLELDELALKLFCRYCKYFDPCGVFSVGKLGSHARYEDLKKHNSSEPHRRCLQMHRERFPDTLHDMQQGENRLTSNMEPRHWSILFPWIQHEKATDTLFCEPCQQDGMTGNLVAGVTRANITMSEVEEHEVLVSHRTAVVQHKRRHLATLTVSSIKSLSSPEKVNVKNSSVKRKRGRPKTFKSSEIVQKLEAEKIPLQGEKENARWTETFWAMASRLRHLGILCDVNLSVGTDPENMKTFQAHKLVLVCASEFFKACLRDNSFEQYYHFNNISVKGMDGILNFIYGEHNKTDPEHYQDVYEAASIFAIPSATAYYQNLVHNHDKEIITTKSDSNRVEELMESKTKHQTPRDEGEDKIDPSDDEELKSSNVIQTSEAEDSSVLNRNNLDEAVEDVVWNETPKSVETSNDKKTEENERIEDRKRVYTRTLPTCNICGKKFLRFGFLKRHKERKHFRNRDHRVFKCDFCPKVCRTPKDIKLHRRRHTGERPFLCNQCGKAFTRRETLMEHAYVHKPDSDKPHKCTECGKGFFKLFDLQRHFTGIHSGLKPFQCHLCGKSFAWSRSLQDHLAGHMGKSRRFTCEHCDMKFIRKYDLQRHQVKHEAKKPYRCNWCGRFFTQKSSLDKHHRDYCRSKPDRKTGVLPSTVAPPIAIQHPQPPPQHYDQPVNLTAGVKDMTINSMELGQSHANDTTDLNHVVPPPDSGQQGFSAYDSFAVSSNLVPQNHVGHTHVYSETADMVGGTPSDVYHNQTLWIHGQNIDQTNSMLFHHNPVSH